MLGDAADGSRDYAIEINPRLTTSYVGLRALAEFNIAEAMLRAATGKLAGAAQVEAGPRPFRPGRHGVSRYAVTVTAGNRRNFGYLFPWPHL